ncbi:DUF397 domain-containing protein [Streptomyces olivaceus]|nr:MULTISPECIES: DUF397 domain-containing protein [Streptomyces]MBF8174243.1 DUF397 domain-containing protein [Streptomyces olivaceus]MBZ6138411.1 DUF397 domain-containing protein [Streptomyces olivaceus]MBZ6168130.1 DUF397 domain-containing protein [Streptomyces olivaceus]QIP73793.1 DUF397 domain-containing protein [Streptomyces sp. VN1]
MTDQPTELAVPESAWFKSSYSSGGGGECVEVAIPLGTVLIRDSKQPAAARLAVSADAWAGFVRMAAER